ncbi:MAG: TetR/AcrR family transcriptional regulator [Pseudonocardia sp.]|uniref:TetR/AcrR family transcriptional regulator n=1 Tax=Pseudonocardia sp. TaxID=60912 RepID=UPI001ACEE89A|nr:TetR family transcriptional regulator [Pseudonocardia sp.]MBN9100072.1 TetR/AcrR family transcriptional regulator [Pseudonocardia sp.]
MTEPAQPPSARREELLGLAYAHVLRHGLSGMSLRPLAEAIGSSPRVLIYLFGSKDGLVRALLGRARADELAVLPDVGHGPVAVGRIWNWLSAPEHRALLTLWVESYARSLVEPDGPWAGFAEATVRDWLAVLGGATGSLAVLRGALLDLLATGDVERTTAAVRAHVRTLTAAADDREADGSRP